MQLVTWDSDSESGDSDSESEGGDSDSESDGGDSDMALPWPRK